MLLVKTNKQNKRFELALELYESYRIIQLQPAYKWLLIFVGFPLHFVVFFIYFYNKKKDDFSSKLKEARQALLASGYKKELINEYKEQLIRKQIFFKEKIVEKKLNLQAEKWAEEKLNQTLFEKLEQQGTTRVTYTETFQSLLSNQAFFFITLIPSLPMHLLILLFQNSYLKYIFERLIMSIFVIIGVVLIVFSILYVSPFDPAAHILGETATKEQIAAFNQLYGLDQPYFVQLWNAIKGIATFNLGSSFSGNEDVVSSILRKLPITLIITVISLIFAIVIAIPIGIISAIKRNSLFDYTFMFIALIGLSIPNFWQGLIFILNFSIKLQWLPATFNPQNWLSIIMPIIVLGTGLTASIARIMRSSMLEIIHEDYIITAKAKGLSSGHVLWRHAVGNAMIPVITVIGLLFGAMVGGTAVTERVFNISGIGSFIVEKQLIPDIPSILGGVVYIAITISIINLFIDISYTFFDPRIRTKIKNQSIR